MSAVNRSGNNFVESVARQLVETLDSKRREQSITTEFQDVLKKLVLGQPEDPANRTAKASPPAAATEASSAPVAVSPLK